jgi:hypothetical protein
MIIKTYTQDELQEILKKHKMWLNNEAGEERANFQEADLRESNFQEANLLGADFQGSDLRGANFQEADLRGANFQEADIDYSCWPLWCGSFGVKIDKRIAAQLAYHFCRTICDDPEVIAAQNALLPLANQFHRVEKCGEIKPKRKRGMRNGKVF